jgi:hypothetical protein
MDNLIQRSRRPLFSARTRRLALSFVALMALHFSAGTGLAGVEFQTTLPAFTAAATSFSLMGTENWSSAGNAPAAAISDPLAPGVANGPFATGTSVASGIQVQSNTLGESATNTMPGGGLFYAPMGFAGQSGNKQPSNQVSVNLQNESFDIIFSSVAGKAPRAVSLVPTFYRLGNNTVGSVTIQVYNQANILIGSNIVANVQDSLESAFIGITTTGSDVLGRVNLWASTSDAVGADNISVYGSAGGGGGTGAKLFGLQLAGSSFSVRLDAEPGQRFRILASTDLTTWVPVQTNTLTSASQQLTLPASGNARFYQAELLP